MAVDLSESWIDEQIARELEMLSVEDLEADEDSKEAEEEEAFQDGDQSFPTLPSCLEDYLHVMADQRQHVVSILDETRAVFELVGEESRVITPTPPHSPQEQLLDKEEEQLPVEEWIREETKTSDQEREDMLAELAKLDQERVERERQLEEEERQTQELLHNMQQQVRLEWARLEDAKREKQAEEERRRTTAATVLQSSWRGTRARKAYRSLIMNQLEAKQKREKENIAATVIEKSWLKHRNRTKTKPEYSVAIVQCDPIVMVLDGESMEKATSDLLEKKESLASDAPSVAVAVLSRECEEEKALSDLVEGAPVIEPAVSLAETSITALHPPTSTPPRSATPPTPKLAASAPTTSASTLLQRTSLQSATPITPELAMFSPPTSTSTLPQSISTTITHPRSTTPPCTTQPAVSTPPTFTSTLPQSTYSAIMHPRSTTPPCPAMSTTSTNSLPQSTITTHTPALPQAKKEDKKLHQTKAEQSNKQTSQPAAGQSSQSVMEDERAVEEELAKMRGLQESWLHEELVAEQSRERMERLMAARESITVDSEDSEYRMRLEHAACPLSERAWHGLVEERLKRWQQSIPSRRPVNPLSHHTSPPILQEKNSRQSRRPLSVAQLLDASPKGVSLDQVAMVHVYKSRSPVDLSCLSQCPALQSLSLTKCSITAFSAVSNPLLRDISLPTNTLELMDCSQLPQLKFLDISDNRLASIHGLQHCTLLLHLNIADNRIARIGGLWACQKLQSLTADGNLIINSVGVESLHCLQYLSLAENHLPKLVGVVNCPLLQHVDVRQNNLQQCPQLINHVLLRELHLDENSISDITPLTSGWLPSLQTLSLANNCIMEMESLVSCVMLQHLNIANNSLYDLSLFLQSVRGCYQLQSLTISGNPLTQEAKYRSFLVKVLPNLREIDGEKLRRVKKAVGPSRVHPLHQLLSRQLAEQDAMRERHHHTITAMEDQSEGPSSPSTIAAVISTRAAHCKEYHHLLLRHSEEQRLFDCASNEPVTVTIQKKQVRAVTVLQSAFRGWRVRRWSGLLLQQWRAAHVIQTAWRRCVSWRVERRRRDTAATVIQASIRGYLLRERLRNILKEAQSSNEEDEEVRGVDELLSAVIDERLLECDLQPLSPTEDQVDCMVTSHISYSEDHRHSKPAPQLPGFTLPGAVEDNGIDDSEEWESLQRFTEVSKHDTEVFTSEQTSTPLSTSLQRREKLADEWGFASPETAKLLMRRAGRHQQLKMRSVQRKKLASPTERLAQFRRVIAEPVDQMRWREGGRVPRYVKASPTIAEQNHDVEFQWQHNHQVIHRDTAVKLSPVLSTLPHSHSKKTGTHASQFLPPLEPHISRAHPQTSEF